MDATRAARGGEATVRTLTAAPALGPLLLRGALRSPLKRTPHTGAPLPGTRLVLPSARIDARRLAAYAEVCGFPEPGPEVPLPLPYPHVPAFPLAMRVLTERAFPLPVLGLVHTAIEVTRPGPPLLPGDRPELSVHAAALVPHRRGTEVVVVTEARLDGELVWESRSRYLARHPVPPGSAPAPGEPMTTEPAPAEPATTDGGAERAVEWRLPGGLGRRYGSASGDRNPIHLHPLTARLFGFPRAIAHGMWTFARCLAEADRQGGPELRGGQPVAARAAFRAPVLLPGTVRCVLRDAGAGATAFTLRSGDGRTHLDGEARYGDVNGDEGEGPAGTAPGDRDLGPQGPTGAGSGSGSGTGSGDLSGGTSAPRA
ncbi:MaoC/PaaZ C-terminal domain-containing protein [Streptomyces sp. NPDC005805]|uniref:MaoC/PaaZ C-terminal domain-containing protein n=1 Tax=Streptomyces sp. NPDC005805 TaxID=3157068 RepID=UPI00340D151B